MIIQRINITIEWRVGDVTTRIEPIRKKREPIQAPPSTIDAVITSFEIQYPILYIFQTCEEKINAEPMIKP